MGNTTSIVDQSNLTENEAAENSKLRALGKRQGIDNGNIREPLPELDRAPCERVRQSKNNSFLVMGRDRPAGRSSGFGGRGATQCGRIDLITGIGSSFKREDGSYGPPNKNMILSPNFALDAARIYISQKAHIDSYMGIAEISPEHGTENRSAIGLKADCVRIHGRQDIKIVTGRSRLEGTGKDGERLSTGGKIDGIGSISLIAGNYTDDEAYIEMDPLVGIPRKAWKAKLQPLPKGYNLVSAFEDLCEIMLDLAHRINENTRKQSILAKSYKKHIHEATPGFGGPSTPSFGGLIGATFLDAFNTIDKKHTKLAQVRINDWKKNFINDFDSPKYINSKHVYTT